MDFRPFWGGAGSIEPQKKGKFSNPFPEVDFREGYTLAQKYRGKPGGNLIFLVKIKIRG
jgi:hypothetical protein